jgi:hypothetical protein
VVTTFSGLGSAASSSSSRRCGCPPRRSRRCLCSLEGGRMAAPALPRRWAGTHAVGARCWRPAPPGRQVNSSSPARTAPRCTRVRPSAARPAHLPRRAARIRFHDLRHTQANWPSRSAYTPRPSANRWGTHRGDDRGHLHPMRYLPRSGIQTLPSPTITAATIATAGHS